MSDMNASQDKKNNLLKFISKTSTQKLGFYLSSIGMGLLFSWCWIKDTFFPDNSTIIIQTMETLIFASAMFLFGCVGMICAIRKEMPQLITLRGPIAVFFGIWIVSVFWGGGLYALIRYLLVLLGLFE